MIELHSKTISKMFGDKINLQPARFTSFIQCDCQHCGGLMVNGIELDYHRWNHKDGTPRSAHVYFNIIRQACYAWPITLWTRIKTAWSVLRGKESAYLLRDDIVLNRKGVKQLRDTCLIALENWPTDEDLSKPTPTLAELFERMNVGEE